MSNDKRKGPVLGFFSALWSGITWLRRTLANLLFILIIVIVVVALGQRETDVLPERFALHLTPHGQLVDQRQPVDPLAALAGNDSRHGETLVRDLVHAINRGAKDDRVTHLVLDLNELTGGGISKLREVGQALENFKQAGKPIIALGDEYMQDQYYLASYADTIYLHDMGHVLLTGYASHRLYLKEAIDKLGINFHIFRAGKFKDAVEPFTRNDMSDASRQHNSQWLNSLWDHYTSRVEALRSLPVGAVNDLIANSDRALAEARGDAAQMALNAGLVDKVASRQQTRAELIELFGYDKQADSFQSVDWYRYLGHEKHLPLPGKSYVGLINATGPIYEGEQPPATVGSDTLIQLLRQVRDDSSIKALVIRIDSPGGSAFASEVIRAEIVTTRDAGIPVIVSMGSVAASGGYWIATAADEIWALPTTITGSIGVFSLIPTLEESLKKLGIHSDGVSTTPLAGALNPTRPLTEDAARVMQLSVDSIYQRFLSTVAESRGLTLEQVDRIGQGRVWSGARAAELGLVDKLGTLEDALAAAAQYAELDGWEIREISPPLTPTEQLLQQLAGVGVTLPMPDVLGQWQALGKYLPSAKLWDFAPRQVYAHCLGCGLVE
ncbi:signal peptide peptidase SppA [Gilvimarinus algae]|uniref:Signal peptide peptidase SppA n=1 Tax=Gilvimarinus algae TaxID=3058037 RepID=A0ABT8TDV5_9GAMM|nr:signal peptide peptidase SppA [Gilvimarinus sp. SDUM040014]MDO3382101.1 signal peptide peptidase SppA [Gilvimarinus sp. SDUM040014]